MRTPRLFQFLLGQGKRQASTARFHIAGMTCEGCVERARKSISSLPAISLVQIDLATGNTTILYESDKVSIEDIQRQILAAGFHGRVGIEDTKP